MVTFSGRAAPAGRYRRGVRSVLDFRAGLPADLPAILRRPSGPRPPEALATVREVLEAVRAEGDPALARYMARFDKVELAPERFRVGPDEIEAAWAACDPALLDALQFAADRIEAYHRHQIGPAQEEVDDGVVRVVELRRVVDRAGLYAPGGRYSYPSSVLMLAIPARVAGVPEIALCVPPRADGSVHPASLAAARLAGVDEVWRLGGAQAIAALAYGTKTVPPVDVIAGPGNVYVALAQQEVLGAVGVHALNGPSEVAIVADAGAPPEWIALDLYAQAEHDPLGSCLLVTWVPELADQVVRGLDELVKADHRAWLAEAAADGGRTVLVSSPEQALEVVNAYAPEHLQLMVADPEPLLEGVRHAGAVFCGYDVPTALGDYVAGPNHVLPTAGTARFAQSLRVSAFEKITHAVFVRPGGLEKLVEPAALIADAEGLTAHAQSLRRRLQ